MYQLGFSLETRSDVYIHRVFAHQYYLREMFFLNPLNDPIKQNDIFFVKIPVLKNTETSNSIEL